MRLKQSFQNKTDRTQFINLELSAARFRLDPNVELILHYNAVDERNRGGCALRVELIASGDSVELVIWTAEEEMFFPDGRPAPQDHDRT